MKQLTYVHPHYLPQLQQELVAAIPELAPVPGPDGRPIAVMALSDDGTDAIFLTVPDQTDEQDVEAVVLSHVPNPPIPVIEYAATVPVAAITRTTDASPKEVFRFPTEQKRRYEADLKISGVDAGNFASKVMEGRFVWKRTIVVSPVVVGLTVVSDIHDAAAASWAPNFAPDGSDIVFTVAGAAGRTIDWLLKGEVDVFAPEGLS